MIHCVDESVFSIPKTDVLMLPIENTSAERIAAYIATELRQAVLAEYNFEFLELEIEVEETPGQSAIYTLFKE